MGAAVLWGRRWRGLGARGGNVEVSQGAPPSHTKGCPQNAPLHYTPIRTHSGFFPLTHPHTFSHTEGQTVYRTHLVANVHSFKQN